MQDVGSSQLLEHLAGGAAGGAATTKAELARSLLGGRDQIHDVLVRRIRAHHQDLSTIAASLSANPATAPVAGLVQNAFIQGFKQDARLFQVGYRITSGVHTVTVAYNNMNDKRPFNADRYSYGAAYTYALSKRTDVSAVLTHLENKNTSQDFLGGNGFIGGVAASPGKDVNSIAVSIRHRF